MLSYARSRLSPRRFHTITSPVQLEALARNRLRSRAKDPQTPVAVISHPHSVWVETTEISGRKPLLPRTPFRLENPTAACQGGVVEPFRAIAARFVEPCGPPHVSAQDASDSVTASRQLSASTHASVKPRLGQKTCAFRRAGGSGVSRRRKPASVSPRTSLFTCYERFLLEQAS